MTCSRSPASRAAAAARRPKGPVKLRLSLLLPHCPLRMLISWAWMEVTFIILQLPHSLLLQLTPPLTCWEICLELQPLSYPVDPRQPSPPLKGRPPRPRLAPHLDRQTVSTLSGAFCTLRVAVYWSLIFIVSKRQQKSTELSLREYDGHNLYLQIINNRLTQTCLHLTQNIVCKLGFCN